jgi:transposase
MLRGILRCDDFGQHFAFSRQGPHRPSIDPVLMIRMLIIGYVFAIRSERGLCRELQVNLAYRWFCGLSIEDKIPDHSAFSRARNERFRDSGILRLVFERVVEACITAGFVDGRGFAVDAKHWGRAMMGRLNGDQGQLLYCFRLEEMVPADHLVREIADVLDLSWVHGELAPYYSPLGTSRTCRRP